MSNKIYCDPRTEVSVNLIRELRKEQENRPGFLEGLAEGAVKGVQLAAGFVMEIPPLPFVTKKSRGIYQLIKSRIEQYQKTKPSLNLIQ